MALYNTLAAIKRHKNHLLIFIFWLKFVSCL